MTATDFDTAQTAADGQPNQQAGDTQGGCCGPCDPCEAYTFKQACDTRRLSAGGDPSISRQLWRRYQARKCGPLEYNIYDSSLAASGYFTQPRNIALADGLAPQEPPDGKRGFRFGCCLLEAKYSQPNRGRALYIDRATFVRTARQKRWLVNAWNISRNSPGGRILRIFRRMPLSRFAGNHWDQHRREAQLQASIYAAFCNSDSTPYTNFLYICGERNWVRAYFSPIAARYTNGRACHSTVNNPENWITSGRPAGC